MMIPDKNIVVNFLIEKKYQRARHICMFLFLLFVAFQNVYGTFEQLHAIIIVFFANLCCTTCSIYTNMYILIPRFLYKGRITAYVISLLATAIVIIALFFTVAFPLFREYTQLTDSIMDASVWIVILNISYSVITVLLVCTGITSIELFRRWIIHDRQIAELEQATMETELQQLKNQINPHFLFNMLNNANTLVRENKDKASQVLLQLDDMLRYQLNDSTRKLVYLNADIQFLTGFLELEKIRRDKFEFVISREGNINNVMVPPLLFIPFVENAIKHNPDSENLSFVHLFFKVKNDELSFICKNSKPRIPVKKQAGGIGLHNIKRRLELLYKNNYCLETEETDTAYTVYLYLNL